MALSVVIPTLNAATTIGSALDSVPGSAEVVVVDGGSGDRTREVAAARGVRVLRAEAGRAQQMNRGAEAASGDALLFLHADCRLPEDAGAAVERALRDPGCAGGWFPLRVLPETWIMRRAANGSNRRARLLALPYGDQAIFARASAFRAAGGFPEDPIMEDAGLARRLRRIGRLAEAPSPVVTGPGHWSRRGPVLAGLIDQMVLAAWLLGVPPKRIAPAYYSLTRPKSRDPAMP